MLAFVISIGFVMAMAGASLLIARRLPDGEVPTHFDIRGKADQFGSRWVVLGVLPVFYALLACALLAMGYVLGDAFADDAQEAIIGAVIGGALIFLAHCFMLWLMLRWVRSA